MSAEEMAVEAAQCSVRRNAAHWAALRAEYSAEEIAAITRIYNFARQARFSSSGKVCMRLLVGLYNGDRFLFDLTDLRLLDRGNLDAALALLRLDAERTRCEVHDLLDAIYTDGYSTGAEFEQWAYDRKFKGRCTKENLSDAGRIRP